MYVKYVHKETNEDILYLDEQITHAPMESIVCIEGVFYIVTSIMYLYTIVESQNSNSLKMFSNKLSVVIYISPVSKDID